MKLNPILKKRFRTIGHQLKPVVTISSKGVTDLITQEIGRALEDHELIKIKINSPDRDERTAIIEEIIEKNGALKVDTIGKILLCYRAAEKPKAKLSNLLRHAV